eukprot:5498817-Alexandrium_andersonii.AAC.1
MAGTGSPPPAPLYVLMQSSGDTLSASKTASSDSSRQRHLAFRAMGHRLNLLLRPRTGVCRPPCKSLQSSACAVAWATAPTTLS